MKMVKSLLLGTAAGLVAMTGAQAADLPVKAKPVQYVKICSLYGVGFYYIPGTDMCVKIGGWVRSEIGYGYNGSLTFGGLSANLNNRSNDDMVWRRRGYLTADARNQTEYGTVRSYIAVGISDNDTGDVVASLQLVNVNRAFIQWAGFTIGQATSFFDFYNGAAVQYGVVGSIGSDSGDAGWKVAAYTAQFGNGLSATISAEMSRRGGIINAGTAAGSGVLGIPTAALRLGYGAAGTVFGNGDAGSDYPDLVANLRIDQTWGSAQVMGALHGVQGLYYTGVEGSGGPSTEIGWALGAGLKLNAPMIGKGDYFQTQFTYASGASRYTAFTAAPLSPNSYDGNSYGFGYVSDGVYGGLGATASSIQLTESWSVNASYEHFWNERWRTSLWGAYRAVNYNSSANAMMCSSIPGAGAGAGTTAVAAVGCNMDSSMWGIGSRTQWNVTKDFYLGVEVLYQSLKSASMPGGVVVLGANGTKPAGVYSVSDMDNWSFRFRAHKDFYP
jgi:hypothetical protein